MEMLKNFMIHIRVSQDTLTQLYRLEVAFRQNRSVVIRNLINIASASLPDVDSGRKCVKDGCLNCSLNDSTCQKE